MGEGHDISPPVFTHHFFYRVGIQPVRGGCTGTELGSRLDRVISRSLPRRQSDRTPEMKFAFPIPEQGANDQSFRMIVRPDVWGKRARIRLSNVFGTKPVTFDGVFIGLQASGSAVMARTSAPLTFGGANAVIVEPGKYAVSDPTLLTFVRDPNDPMLTNRRLAVSFHIAGESGPMTWHAKSLTSSYLTLPGAGSRGSEENESAFPQSTTSWYFLDEVDMEAPQPTKVVVAFGDSITDGTASTINGDDRWPDGLWWCGRSRPSVFGGSAYFCPQPRTTR